MAELRVPVVSFTFGCPEPGELERLRVGYPDVHHVTAPLRAAARERGDPDGFRLWAGQAHALAEPLPAAELVRRLVARLATIDPK